MRALIVLFLCATAHQIVAQSSPRTGFFATQGNNVIFETSHPEGAFLFNGHDILSDFSVLQGMFWTLSADFQALKSQLVAEYVSKVI